MNRNNNFISNANNWNGYNNVQKYTGASLYKMSNSRSKKTSSTAKMVEQLTGIPLIKFDNRKQTHHHRLTAGDWYALQMAVATASHNGYARQPEQQYAEMEKRPISPLHIDRLDETKYLPTDLLQDDQLPPSPQLDDDRYRHHHPLRHQSSWSSGSVDTTGDECDDSDNGSNSSCFQLFPEKGSDAFSFDCLNWLLGSVTDDGNKINDEGPDKNDMMKLSDVVHDFVNQQQPEKQQEIGAKHVLPVADDSYRTHSDSSLSDDDDDDDDDKENRSGMRGRR